MVRPAMLYSLETAAITRALGNKDVNIEQQGSVLVLA